MKQQQLLLPPSSTSEVALRRGLQHGGTDAQEDATPAGQSLKMFTAEEFTRRQQGSKQHKGFFFVFNSSLFSPSVADRAAPGRRPVRRSRWPPHLHDLRARWVESVSMSSGCGGFLTDCMTYNSEWQTSEAAFRPHRAAERQRGAGCCLELVLCHCKGESRHWLSWGWNSIILVGLL